MAAQQRHTGRRTPHHKAMTMSLNPPTNVLIIVALLSLPLLVFCNNERTSSDLYADQQLDLQTILPGDTKIYYLHNLAPHSHYETPADFELEIMERMDHHNSRQLLNIAKVMFTTDNQGYITDRVRPLDGFYRVKVTVTSTGVLPDKSTKESPIQYNIVLETLLLGAPFDVVKIGVFVAVMCVLMATILVPQLFPHLPGFNNLVD